jgi:hypothetical protein
MNKYVFFISIFFMNHCVATPVSWSSDACVVLSDVGDIILNISIKNNSTEVIAIPVAEVPWEFSSMISVQVIIPQSKKAIDHSKENRITEGVPSALIHLRPGECIHGSVSLKDISPNLGEYYMNSEEIILVWYYCSGWTAGAPELVAGTALIGRGKVINLNRTEGRAKRDR